jgi:hypothetical protein
LQEISDIRRIMERSSRFLSLSGLSGIAAGLCAIIGAWLADRLLHDFRNSHKTSEDFDVLQLQLLGLAVIVFVTAVASAFFFTWRKAKSQGLPVWDHTSRRLFWNLIIPLISGGLFILAMLQHGEWIFVSSACLIFYGLALVNGSKYTLHEIRWLGLMEIVLGLVNTQYPGYGLYFWALGFGVLHIIYGAMMWWKYERVQ